jgi:hypothetical protein
MEPKARDVGRLHVTMIAWYRDGERSVETIAVENVAPEIVKSEDLRS